jgi:hypothetical protein
MRKYILGLVLVLAGTFAVAGFKGETSTANLGLLNIIQCSTGISCTKSGAKMVVANANTLLGAGSGSVSGYLQAQVASSTTSLTAAQCGSTIVSNSADVVTLPEASTVLGCRYTFVCGTADDFDVNPADATDAFGPVNVVGGGTASALAPSAGDAIRCTDIGSSVTIEATGASLWSAIGVANGPWTDVN